LRFFLAEAVPHARFEALKDIMSVGFASPVDALL
jgi:hypothetical protein